jgi:hypothetical protein
MGRESIQRRALELIFKGNRPKGRRRTRWFSQVLEDIWELGDGKESKRKNCGRKKNRDFFFIKPYKTGIMLED